jgi:hypothetical protein
MSGRSVFGIFAGVVLSGLFAVAAGPAPKRIALSSHVTSACGSLAAGASIKADSLRVVEGLRADLESRAASGCLRNHREAMREAPSRDTLNYRGMALLLTGSPGDALFVLCEAACTPPPVPALAAEVGKDAQLRLHLVRTNNSAECISARGPGSYRNTA